MTFENPRLISRTEFEEVRKGFVIGWISEDIPELTTIVHITLGPLTVVLFESPDYVLVMKGNFEDCRDQFPDTIGTA